MGLLQMKEEMVELSTALAINYEIMDKAYLAYAKARAKQERLRVTYHKLDRQMAMTDGRLTVCDKPAKAMKKQNRENILSVFCKLPEEERAAILLELEGVEDPKGGQ